MVALVLTAVVSIVGMAVAAQREWRRTRPYSKADIKEAYLDGNMDEVNRMVEHNNQVKE